MRSEEEWQELEAERDQLAMGLEQATRDLARLKAEWEKEAVTAFAHEVWNQLLAKQRTHKVLPLTLAGRWLAERHQAEEGEALGKALAVMKRARRDTPTAKALDEAIADVEALRRRAERGEP